MKIRKETIYIAEDSTGEKQIRLGERVKLIFKDGTCHAGELTEILDRVVTIGRSDGEYSYSIAEIQSIEQ